MKIQTINQLISVWKDIATRHYQINYFGVGDSWEIGVDNASMHPVLWVNPTTANMPSSDNGYKTFEIDFEVRCFDLVNKDESNENEVLSDTIDILKDIITEFKGHPYYVNSQLNIIDDISFEAFTEEFDEEVSGWLCEISLMTPVLTTFCGIPSADITGYEFPGIDCPDSNVLCPVFVDDVTGVYPIEVTTIGTTKEVSLAVPVGEVNDSSNSGTGEGLALAKSGVDLPFKSIQAGTNITIDSTATDITINSTSGGGEDNTSSNSGGGEGLALTKVGVDLPFKTITAGANITLNSSATELEIVSTATGGEDNTTSNSGGGETLALAKVGVDLPFKTITAGANITLNATATELEIVASSGGGNTIYTSDDSLAGARTVTLAGFNLNFYDGQTTFRGDNSSGATRWLRGLNSLGATLLDARNNGIFGYGGGANLTVSHYFLNPANTGTVAGFRHNDGSAILNISNTHRNVQIYAHANQLSVEMGQDGSSSKLNFWHKGTQLIRLNNGTLNYFNMPSMVFGGTGYIGAEDFSIQGDTLVKGSDTSASTVGFEITDSANTSLLDVRNNGDIYTTGLQGLSETVTFGGGSTGDVATLTYTNGIVTGKTLVP